MDCTDVGMEHEIVTDELTGAQVCVHCGYERGGYIYSRAKVRVLADAEIGLDVQLRRDGII